MAVSMNEEGVYSITNTDKKTYSAVLILSMEDVPFTDVAVWLLEYLDESDDANRFTKKTINGVDFYSGTEKIDTSKTFTGAYVLNNSTLYAFYIIGDNRSSRKVRKQKMRNRFSSFFLA